MEGGKNALIQLQTALDSGLCVNTIVTLNKATLLHVASTYQQIGRSENTNKSAMVKLLLSRGADVHAEDQVGVIPNRNPNPNPNLNPKAGQTPLHCAAFSLAEDSVRLLLTHGAAAAAVDKVRCFQGGVLSQTWCQTAVTLLHLPVCSIHIFN